MLESVHEVLVSDAGFQNVPISSTAFEIFHSLEEGFLHYFGDFFAARRRTGVELVHEFLDPLLDAQLLDLSGSELLIAWLVRHVVVGRVLLFFLFLLLFSVLEFLMVRNWVTEGVRIFASKDPDGWSKVDFFRRSGSRR